jgi:hypothetical protein
MFTIPTTVQLAGLTITTTIDDNLFKERKILGEARYPQQQILVDGDLLHDQSKQQNYCHELVHWILYVMSEDDLRNNEKFVETFSFFLHQALSTWEGNVNDRRHVVNVDIDPDTATSSN